MREVLLSHLTGAQLLLFVLFQRWKKKQHVCPPLVINIKTLLKETLELRGKKWNVNTRVYLCMDIYKLSFNIITPKIIVSCRYKYMYIYIFFSSIQTTFLIVLMYFNFQYSTPASSTSTSSILQRPLSRFTRCLSWTTTTTMDKSRKVPSRARLHLPVTPSTTQRAARKYSTMATTSTSILASTATRFLSTSRSPPRTHSGAASRRLQGVRYTGRKH